MNTKALFNHNEALIARYGIKEIESFRRSARRYECRISWLNEVRAVMENGQNGQKKSL